MPSPIYFDNNATTQPFPEVVDLPLPTQHRKRMSCFLVENEQYFQT